jgi:hypothetical protein
MVKYRSQGDVVVPVLKEGLLAQPAPQYTLSNELTQIMADKDRRETTRSNACPCSKAPYRSASS